MSPGDGPGPDASPSRARHGARAALREAAGDLRRWPTVTALALVAATTATLILHAGTLRAARLAAAAVTHHDLAWGLAGRALGTLLSAAALAGLLVDIVTTSALSAYAGPPPPAERGRLWPALRLGLERTPALITVRAVELVIYYALAVGTLFVLVRGLGRAAPAAATRALAATLLLAPGLVLGALTFAAARVAQLLVARGLPPAPALAHGLDVTLRRFASLARLGLWAALATAPLWISGLVLPRPLAAPLWSLAALWSWAALARLVGRDERLAFG